MKSIKPGRGPSMMGGISALFAALFGVFWIIVVLQSGGGFFAFFGVIFIAMALVQAWYNFHNASQKDRFSSFDIVWTPGRKWTLWTPGMPVRTIFLCAAVIPTLLGSVPTAEPNSSRTICTAPSVARNCADCRFD